MGKTYFAILRLIWCALHNPYKLSHYFYIAPTHVQAKRIAFEMLISFVQDIPGSEINRSELSVTFHNNATIKLLGAEQADSLRGIFADGIVIDETALISSQAWSLVLAPTLVDRLGWVIFIGTPMTRMNLFYEQYALAEHEPEYYRCVYTVEDTDIIPKSEIIRLKRTLKPAEFEQELMCSWDGAVLGSYYRDPIKKLIDDGRFGIYDHDKTLPVYAALDLGYGDLTVWGIFQKSGNRINIIDCVAFEQTSIPDQVTEIRKLAHCPTALLLPHDAEVHGLATGKTRTEVFQQLGFACTVVPLAQVADGIEMVHDLLATVCIDERCKVLLEALIAYRANFDPIKQVHTIKPVHDWSSHYCDMVRYMAAGEGLLGEWIAIDYRRYNRGIV